MSLAHNLLGAACILALTSAALIPLKERKPEDSKIKLVTPSQVDVDNHGEVRMECIFYNLVWDDIIVWKKGNDEPIFMDHDSAIDDTRFAIDNEETENADGGRKSVMTLERIDSSDDNTYYCGSVETNTFIPIRMRVKIHPTARMTPDHWPYIVLNLQPVSLKCSVTGNPLPKINWFKEGGQIPPHISVQGDTLHIMSAQKSDAGIYVCHANNTAGTAIAKTDLRVHDPHDITGAVSPPWARMAVGYAPVAMNGRINISCSYDGNPSPTVEWLFNGAKLTHGRPTNVGMNNLKQYGIRHDNHSESILEIISASPDYFGDYSCKVTNEHGTAKDVTYLSAMPSPPDLSLDGTRLTVTAQAPPTGIEELALFFRKPNESGWINKKSIAVAKGDQTGEKTWSKQINLSDFLESGQFEIQVQARNNYGYGNKANDMIRVTVPEKSDVPTASAPMAASSSVIAALLLLIGR
ncbi:wrk-1 [Pristionchus pacificus]|uniref:Immunoglobulin n=1 Tax=Pristionchus pacificus TaxID=54126 RepID=A0A2A6D1E4_PRIPA|nr:wrk-1 [Pristionchus pacificus]|eukprot:PDM84235.1 Immunoglobulin [Pristionchus pacificus]